MFSCAQIVRLTRPPTSYVVNDDHKIQLCPFSDPSLSMSLVMVYQIVLLVRVVQPSSGKIMTLSWVPGTPDSKQQKRRVRLKDASVTKLGCKRPPLTTLGLERGQVDGGKRKKTGK